MNVRRVQDQIHGAFESREPKPQVGLVDIGATGDTSVTVIDAWVEIDQYLAPRGARLWVAAIPPRTVEKVKRIDIYREWLDAGRIHPSARVAVDRFESARSGGIQS